VIDLSRRLGERFRVRAVRLDSGDLGELARETRRLLDEAGLGRVGIFASSGLDEYEIARLVAAGAPIDAFGVGTKLAVADGGTYLDMAYKLVEYDGRPRLKLSSGKVLYPGRKQVFRRFEEGQMAGDVVGRYDEKLAGEPLLRPVLRGGRRVEPAGRVPLAEARAHALRERSRLPGALRQLERAEPPYPVEVSEALASDFAVLSRAAGF
jgi:nicotinate phosphoribosyltransferase